MRNMKPKVSLCFATNGISEWLFPVLDSIYKQDVNYDKYEVIVTDNGNNKQFQKDIKKYITKYPNFIYSHNNSHEFMNQIESIKLARGNLVKVMNHRFMLKEGALQYFVDFEEKYKKEMPFPYFSNGVLKKIKKEKIMETFDEFINDLSIYSSWSAGTVFWKKDVDKAIKECEFNGSFPHIAMLFSKKDASSYIIDNTELMQDVPQDHTKKGKYNLFYEFAVEYLSIITELYRNGFIKSKTLLNIKKDMLMFIGELYLDFVLLKKPCSYDLSNYKDNIKVYYNKKEVLFYSFINLVIRPFLIAKDVIKNIKTKI